MIRRKMYNFSLGETEDAKTSKVKKNKQKNKFKKDAQ